MQLLVAFLLGVIVGGILMEKTRRANVISNSIKKVKTDEGAVDVSQENFQDKPQGLKPGLFRRIFKRKKS